MTDRESHCKETLFGFKKEGFALAMEEPLNMGAARAEIIANRKWHRFGVEPTDEELLAFLHGYNYAVRRIALLCQVKIEETKG